MCLTLTLLRAKHRHVLLVWCAALFPSLGFACLLSFLALLGRQGKLKYFLRRLVAHLGGDVIEEDGFTSFAIAYMHGTGAGWDRARDMTTGRRS